MKSSFVHRPLNSPFDDPVVFVRVLREKRAFLLDLGDISRLDPGDLQKITHVFVTHTHIDHFIGFDTLMRSLLRRDLPLCIYGPANIADCVEGKLKGYTWNLIRDYPLRMDVFSVDHDIVRHTSFCAESAFERRDEGSGRMAGFLYRDDLLTVKTIQLDHQIPCLAYSIEEVFHININKSLLKDFGLPVGPWLSDFKRAIRAGHPAETEFAVAGRRLTLGEMRRIATIAEGQKIAYVTDVSITDDNIERLVEFVRNSDTLYCEAYFLDRDIDRARTRFHLTAKITGTIARRAAVRRLVVMHFSPRYRESSETPESEAMREFMRQNA